MNMLVPTPDLHIVGANAAHLAAVGRNLDDLVGLYLFDAFPDRPHNPAAGACRTLRTGDVLLKLSEFWVEFAHGFRAQLKSRRL
ncbi:hypothetical protein [Microvirga sesbaniae]|uniref:hypothetical protein n=1 Tax=Microvirga sesbaniae TaxID=681392 RepID=UPI0021C751EE|nr:hypothetical protein [Microvirga sp. HBU67692]